MRKTIFGALGLMVWAGSAVAQTPAPVIYGDAVNGESSMTAPAGSSDSEVISAPSQVTACLCEKQALADARTAMDSSRESYNKAQHRAEALQHQASTLRSQIDPNQAESVDAYRRLIAQSEEANAYLYNTATPDYAAAVKRYNAQATQYNTDCAGRGLDPKVKAEVEANLFCPAPANP